MLKKLWYRIMEIPEPTPATPASEANKKFEKAVGILKKKGVPEAITFLMDTYSVEDFLTLDVTETEIADLPKRGGEPIRSTKKLLSPYLKQGWDDDEGELTLSEGPARPKEYGRGHYGGGKIRTSRLFEYSGNSYRLYHLNCTRIEPVDEDGVWYDDYGVSSWEGDFNLIYNDELVMVQRVGIWGMQSEIKWEWGFSPMRNVLKMTEWVDEIVEAVNPERVAQEERNEELRKEEELKKRQADKKAVDVNLDLGKYG